MDIQASPLFIAGTGGSGTRVFAQLAEDLGYFMGQNLNHGHDAMELAGFNERWRLRMLPGQAPLDGHQLRTRQADFDDTIRRHRAGIPDAAGPWGYKHPRDIFLLPFLLENFPGMKFLHVVRDGLDMAFSGNQNQLRDYGPAWLDPREQSLEIPVRSALLWNRVNQMAADLGEQKLKERYCRMRFEDLCLRPQDGLRQLEAFADRSFGPTRESALARVKAPESLGRGRLQEPDLCLRAGEACESGRRRFGYR